MSTQMVLYRPPMLAQPAPAPAPPVTFSLGVVVFVALGALLIGWIASDFAKEP
jgi:hypothetical protein